VITSALESHFAGEETSLASNFMATFFTNEGTFGSRKSGSISFYRHNDIVIDGLKFQRSAKECVTVPRRQEVLVHRSAEV